MTNAAHNLATLQSMEDDPRLDDVIEAISALDADDVLRGATANDLDELSSATLFEGIEPSPDGVFLVKGTEKFEATATIYVTLQYGGSRDGVTMSDSYPAYVTGHFGRDGVHIDDVTVDTSSFYE